MTDCSLNKRSGFTLVEVILAVLILSMGLTVLLISVSRCLAVMSLAKNYQTAIWARGMGDLEFPLLKTNDVSALEVDGEDYEGFIYSREVGDDEDEDGLYKLYTRVSWERSSRPYVNETVTYIYLKPDEEETK